MPELLTLLSFYYACSTMAAAGELTQGERFECNRTYQSAKLLFLDPQDRPPPGSEISRRNENPRAGDLPLGRAPYPLQNVAMQDELVEQRRQHMQHNQPQKRDFEDIMSIGGLLDLPKPHHATRDDHQPEQHIKRPMRDARRKLQRPRLTVRRQRSPASQT